MDLPGHPFFPVPLLISQLLGYVLGDSKGLASRLCLQRWQPLLLGTSVTLRPLPKPKTIKKRTKNFIWHQSDPYVKIKLNWQKPRGTDNRAHRRFKSQILMPNTGYGSDKKTEHRLPSGFQKSPAHSMKELEGLLVCNKSQCAESADNVSTKNHKTAVESAAQLAPRVASPNARLCREENE
ncbi:60S ribosomal protein L32-like [Meles meles]|uniref:60S ribosomal protein L32-like n=1 Tax=Meles meles TaxID=9662 RepID=UPI001E69CDFB|nr:60S ribosomal protein L32-like [Meles meles]